METSDGTWCQASAAGRSKARKSEESIGDYSVARQRYRIPVKEGWDADLPPTSYPVTRDCSS